MTELFRRCLRAEYIHTENDGDFATEIDGNTLYILFQWSAGKTDWLNNFDFPAKPYRRMSSLWFCHRGFLRVWLSMRDIIERTAAAMLCCHPEVTDICCVGYSHGAALAGFCTEDMTFLFGEKYRVTGYGFGCPRFVWGILPRSVKKRFAAFVPVRNIPDIVTHVPPLIFGYSHGGRLLKVGRIGKYSPVRAHYPDAYQTELENYDISSANKIIY